MTRGFPVARLYAYWRSSASWRVRIGLNLKNVPYEVVPVSLLKDGGEQKKPDYVAMAPMAQVPTLEWEEKGETMRLTQSLAILTLVDARCPAPPLLPEDALMRARVWEMAEIVNSGIQPLQNLSTMKAIEALGGDAKAFAAEAIAKGLFALEQLAARSPGAFCVGDRPSLADICLVPQMYNARRFGVSLDEVPTLVAVDARCAELSAFALAHPDVQPDAASAP
ncbi:MAG: maleylacetoacetate isomerase [Myxococcales bacterium]|nr:maleylacetoacetate isomerase [Myxococcales bacterium]